MLYPQFIEEQEEAAMALNGVLRPGYIQIRVTDIDAAAKHYVDRVGLHEVSREADGRVVTHFKYDLC